MGEGVETPSGKGAGDENFPVGSWLLSPRLRPHIQTFYRFARAIDDIADDPALAAEEKIARLSRFEAAVVGEETRDPALTTAHGMRQSLAQTGISARHCTDLIAAFKQDAIKPRYQDWHELMGYCALSANPVGRYLLDLHREGVAGYPRADALCSALQVLNHVQDCQADYRNLDRVYLPLDWMAADGIGVAALDAPRCAPPLRRVLDRCLAGVEDLLGLARLLPGGLASRRLALESAAIVGLAERLSALLRAGDPLAGRVALGRLDFVLRGLRGAGQVLRWRRQARPGPAGAARQGR